MAARSGGLSGNRNIDLHDVVGLSSTEQLDGFDRVVSGGIRVGELSRSELQDWIERVARRAPSSASTWQRIRGQGKPKAREWCTKAPHDVLAVLADEAERRASSRKLKARTHATRRSADDMRERLRQRFAPYAEEAARLERVLEDPACSDADARAVAAFARSLETVEKRRGLVENLARQLEEEAGGELLNALHQAEEDPPRAGRMVSGLKLAQQLVELERRSSVTEAELQIAPNRLTERLAEQSASIKQQQTQLAELDRALEAGRDTRLRIASELEQEEHKRSLISADLDRLDAEFDVLLARARTDPTLDVQDLYETYRERTGRERVWREREQAVAHTEELQSALRSLQLRFQDLQQEVDECADDRSRLLMERDELQSAVNQLLDSNHTLRAQNDALADDVRETRSEAEYLRARSVRVTDAGFTPGVVRALHGAGLYTLGDVADVFPNQIEILPGLGEARVRQIGDVLVSRGLW
jgi:DNA repair exonuclease SbcCD ATPase subunit